MQMETYRVGAAARNYMEARGVLEYWDLAANFKRAEA